MSNLQYRHNIVVGLLRKEKTGNRSLMYRDAPDDIGIPFTGETMFALHALYFIRGKAKWSWPTQRFVDEQLVSW